MRIFETFKRGAASIGKGGATFCLFPTLKPLQFPKRDKSGLELDAERIASYWAVIGDWRAPSHVEESQARVESR